MMAKRYNVRLLKGFILVFLSIVAAPVLTGCSPFTTYPPDGKGPLIYPWMAPGPEVMSTGLMQAHARVDPGQPLIYNLPAGISKLAWDDVQKRLGPEAQPMKPDDKIVWNLERYGIDNTRAFADIGYWNNGKAVLITVSMERENIAPFKVTHVQRWYVDMPEPDCQNPVFFERNGDAKPAPQPETEPETEATPEASGSEGT